MIIRSSRYSIFMSKSKQLTKKQRNDLITRWVELFAFVALAAIIMLVIIHGQQIQNLQEQVQSLEMEESL